MQSKMTLHLHRFFQSPKKGDCSHGNDLELLWIMLDSMPRILKSHLYIKTFIALCYRGTVQVPFCVGIGVENKK
jgi:hypothetical protein